MEALGFLGAIIGLVTAIINRHRIIELRFGPSLPSRTFASVRSPVTVRKRLKRLALCVVAGFFCAAIGGNSESASPVMVVPFAVFLFMGAYQVLAIGILLVVRLWR